MIGSFLIDGFLIASEIATVAAAFIAICTYFRYYFHKKHILATKVNKGIKEIKNAKNFILLCCKYCPCDENAFEISDIYNLMQVNVNVVDIENYVDKYAYLFFRKKQIIGFAYMLTRYLRSLECLLAIVELERDKAFAHDREINYNKIQYRCHRIIPLTFAKSIDSRFYEFEKQSEKIQKILRIKDNQ